MAKRKPTESSLNEQPAKKIFKFVPEWPDDVKDDAITIFSNLGSSYVNVITAPSGSILISCGLIQGSMTKHSLFQKSVNSTSIGPAKRLPRKASRKKAPEVCERSTKLTEQEKKAWNAKATNICESDLKCQVLEKLKEALFKQDGKFIIHLMIFSSKDEDVWNLLPSLCFDANGDFKKDEYIINNIIIHGAPEHYSVQFRSMISKIMKNHQQPGPLVYFTSLTNHLANTDYLECDYLKNPNYKIAPKCYYQGQDVNIQNVTKDIYEEALTKNQVTLPYSDALTLPISRDRFDKRMVRVFFPIINVHHIPESTNWNVPKTLDNNADNLMIGVIIDDNTRLLFLEDAKTEHQLELLRSFQQRRIPYHIDILALAHNADPKNTYKCQEFLEKTGSSVLIVPSFESQHYPTLKYLQSLLTLPGLMRDDQNKHWCLTNEYDVDLRKIKFETSHHIYTLHQPVSIMISNEVGFIRQDEEFFF